jgi:plasmid replication initiation protein
VSAGASPLKIEADPRSARESRVGLKFGGGGGFAHVRHPCRDRFADQQHSVPRSERAATVPEPHNLLKSIRRPTGGAHYDRLRAALERLSHTAVRTNIWAEGKRKFASFHWLEGWTEVIDESTGLTQGMTLTLPDWLFRGIVERGGVLTIHEDYFLLTGGIERWLYRVARKHGGNQDIGLQFTMRQLHEKSGSAARFADFAFDIREVVLADGLPEYALTLWRNREGEEVVGFVRRSKLAITDPRYKWSRPPRRRMIPDLFDTAY